jgi:hypothetical protein
MRKPYILIKKIDIAQYLEKNYSRGMYFLHGCRRYYTVAKEVLNRLKNRNLKEKKNEVKSSASLKQFPKLKLAVRPEHVLYPETLEEFIAVLQQEPHPIVGRWRFEYFFC